MTLEEFEERIRGDLLFFSNEAWYLRHRSSEQLGRAMDEHHVQMRKLVKRIYEMFHPPPAVTPEMKEPRQPPPKPSPPLPRRPTNGPNP